jgi:uncharacterized membrane protein YqaE (UPF0057 family)
MGILLALFAPPISLFASGRPGSALLCLVLQLTLIGWIPAAIWAVVARSEDHLVQPPDVDHAGQMLDVFDRG